LKRPRIAALYHSDSSIDELMKRADASQLGKQLAGASGSG
jgi:hypothetical protein